MAWKGWEIRAMRGGRKVVRGKDIVTLRSGKETVLEYARLGWAGLWLGES